MSDVHPTAIISPEAEVADDAGIGAYSIVGAGVKLSAGVRIASHVVVEGRTEIGDNVRIFSFAAVGTPPQDIKYHGEPSRLTVGANSVIREHATLNPGTEGGGMLTRVGENCLIMIGAHVAHDCDIGDNVILVNNVVLGGHVSIGDHAVVGGQSAVHQYVRIGAHAMIGGKSGIDTDVIPFGVAVGNRAELEGLNLVGMKRRGFARDEIHSLRKAYRELFSEKGSWEERLDAMQAEFSGIGAVDQVIEFLRAETSRALCRPASGS